MKKRHCYFYVTNGWKIDHNLISHQDQIICKTDMKKLERENTRLRHYLVRLHQKTCCYLKSLKILE